MCTCPYCQESKDQVRSGFNRSGSQRYLCKACHRIYTPTPRSNGYPDQTRRQAIQMRRDGMSFRAIGTVLNIRPQSIVNWVEVEERKETQQ